jgi:hypothetical protein
MKERLVIRATVAAVLLAASVTAVPMRIGAADAGGSLSGDWRGDSVCTPGHDACRDEKALYHLTGPDEHNIVTVVGSKLVGGREIVMGPASDFTYHPDKKTLVLENRYGVFRFTVSGTTMEGTLTLPSGELYRKISLKKDPKP